jgi:Regulator of G protein signaling domain
VRELRRSMLVETPELEKAGSKRSSQILDNFNMDGESPHNSEKMGHDQGVSDYLRSQGGNGKNSKPTFNGAPNHSPHESLGSRNSEFKKGSTERPPRPSFMNSDDPRTDSNSPGHTVARADIRASAEKILYTFVLPGSEREIVLPEQILNHIIHAIEEEGRDDPEVFNNAKEYVFQAMERDAFPGFLQAKALGNLVPLSVLLRLGIGLACFMAGFWGGYYMILTNTSRAIRCWVSIPPLFPHPTFPLTRSFSSSPPSSSAPTS